MSFRGELFVRKDNGHDTSPKAVAAANSNQGNSNELLRLISNLKNADPRLRLEATIALGKLGDKKAVEPLIQALCDHSRSVRLQAAAALGRLGGDSVFERLILLLKDQDGCMRGAGILALGALGDVRAADELIIALKDEEPQVRGWAVSALGQLKIQGALAQIKALLGDKDEYVRREAEDTLMSLGAQTNAGPIGAALEKIEGRPASDPLALIKQVESLSSDSDERLRILDQIDSQSFERLDAQRKYYVWFLRGSVYRLQGNRDQAIQCLKKGLEYFSEKSAMAWRVLEELQDPWRHAERWSVSKIKDVTPVYPLDAKRDRIEGVVSLECIIGYRGQVTDVRIVSGISALNQAAIDAVKQWRYERLHNWSDPPALLTVPVVFSLSACSMEPPVVPNIGRDAVKGEPAASIQQPLDSLIVEPLIKALGDSNSSGKLPAPVPAAAPKNRAIRVDWVGDKNTLPNDRNMLEEVTSANTLPIGSVVRLYSSSLPYLMTPGWFKGWRKVLDIHFNKKRIHFVNLDDGTEEDRLFGDTFGGHIRCYTVPADFDASTSRTNRTAISSVDASSLSADALIDYIVEHRTDGDILSLCSSMVEKLQYGFYSQPEDIEKALRTFGDSGMAARFEQIRRTMKPSDLHPLITQVLGRYLKRCS